MERTNTMGKEIPQGRGSGWPACRLVLREKASTLAGGGRAWPGGCPEVSLTRFAQAFAGSVPCGPSVLPGECPAGISPPPAPWKGKHHSGHWGRQLHQACLGGMSGNQEASARVPLCHQQAMGPGVNPSLLWPQFPHSPTRGYSSHL